MLHGVKIDKSFLILKKLTLSKYQLGIMEKVLKSIASTSYFDMCTCCYHPIVSYKASSIYNVTKCGGFNVIEMTQLQNQIDMTNVELISIYLGL